STVRNVALFVAGLVPGCLAVAAIDQHLYGSPLRSGYGDFSTLYAWANAAANLDRYPRWLMETQTPFIGLALLAPWLARRAAGHAAITLRPAHVWLLLGFAGVVCSCYLFYIPFGRDDWGYLRFLLPAYPPLIALSAAVAVHLLQRLTASPAGNVLLPIALAAAPVAWQALEAVDLG